MTMKMPVHPGRLVKNELDDLGLSVTEAAKSLGISRQHLHAVIAGRSAVSPEMAVRLEAGIGSTADTWLRLQVAFDLARFRASGIPVAVAKLAAKVA